MDGRKEEEMLVLKRWATKTGSEDPAKNREQAMKRFKEKFGVEPIYAD